MASPKRSRKVIRYLSAIAAIVALCFFSIFGFLKSNNQLNRELTFRESASLYASQSNFLLDMRTDQLDQVTEWLEQSDSPTAAQLPAALTTNELLGCKQLNWRGIRVSLICFHQADGNIVHLFVIPSQSIELDDLQRTAVAHSLQSAGWTTNGQTYLLVGSSPEVEVTHYLPDATS